MIMKISLAERDDTCPGPSSGEGRDSSCSSPPGGEGGRGSLPFWRRRRQRLPPLLAAKVAGAPSPSGGEGGRSSYPSGGKMAGSGPPPRTTLQHPPPNPGSTLLRTGGPRMGSPPGRAQARHRRRTSEPLPSSTAPVWLPSPGLQMEMEPGTTTS
ncbi:UNVERIFIED_CONTAM: hypothetical protein FKN15_013032 [Acipenser sinensis]